jgi:hypothetical protein
VTSPGVLCRVLLDGAGCAGSTATGLVTAIRVGCVPAYTPAIRTLSTPASYDAVTASAVTWPGRPKLRSKRP